MSVERAPIRFEFSPEIDNEELNALFAVSWADHEERDFQPVLGRSLVYIVAYHLDRPIGFVNVVGDGDVHAFLLDTTVARDYQRQGIATDLIARAARAARDAGARWLHVDFEPHLAPLYRAAGFGHTEAGLLRLEDEAE